MHFLNQTLLLGNYIGDEGAKAIAETLKTNTSLTELTLNSDEDSDSNDMRTYFNVLDNNIEDEGAKAVAEALKMNTSLTEFTLYSDDIDDRHYAYDVVEKITLETKVQRQLLKRLKQTQHLLNSALVANTIIR